MMMTEGYDSPESAAMEGFPPAYCRVIASRVSGDHAYVLLNTGSTVSPYLYGVNCFRKGGRWFESSSSNGPGWAGTGRGLGNLSCWGDAPERATAVRVSFDGRAFEETVIEGAYLLVWWQVPYPSGWPAVSAFEIAGVWRSPAGHNTPANQDPQLRGGV